MVAGLIFLAFYLLPDQEGLSTEGKLMIGLLFVAAYLWITEALPVAITALLVMIAQPILQIQSVDDVFASFGNRAVFFLIGAFMLAAAVERHNLHKRLAMKFLRQFQKSPKRLAFGIMVSSALLSFLVPNHAIAALMLPIVMSILLALRIEPLESNFGKVSVISIAYGCSIGSLGTVIGGARNPLTIAFLEQTAGIEVSFFEWTYYSLPVVLISLPVVFLILTKIYPIEKLDLANAKKMLRKEIDWMGPMKSKERMTLSILLLTVILWIFVSSMLGLAVIALLGGILLFVTGTINWKDAERRIPWGIILLYGGAITLGVSLGQTGAAEWLAGGLQLMVGGSPYVALLVLIVITIILTEFMSNTAAVAVMLPISFGVAADIPGVSPLVAAMAVSLSGGLAFSLVIATPGNIIAYSSGYFKSKDLIRVGIPSAVCCIIIIFMIAITYWKLIGLW